MTFLELNRVKVQPIGPFHMISDLSDSSNVQKTKMLDPRPGTRINFKEAQQDFRIVCDSLLTESHSIIIVVFCQLKKYDYSSREGNPRMKSSANYGVNIRILNEIWWDLTDNRASLAA